MRLIELFCRGYASFTHNQMTFQTVNRIVLPHVFFSRYSFIQAFPTSRREAPKFRLKTD
jgi:hypothetical protein